MAQGPLLAAPPSSPSLSLGPAELLLGPAELSLLLQEDLGPLDWDTLERCQQKTPSLETPPAALQPSTTLTKLCRDRRAPRAEF